MTELVTALPPVPLQPIQLAHVYDDKADSEHFVEISLVHHDENSGVIEQMNGDTGQFREHGDILHAGHYGLISCPQPLQLDDKVDAGQFLFATSAPLANSRIVRGLQKPQRGRSALRVTARRIYNEDLDDFMDGEGQVWHMIYKFPHSGFPRMRATVEGETLNCCMSFIVMDDLDVDLLSFVRERGGLPEARARNIFRQIASAVAHAIDNKIALPLLHLDRIFFTDNTRSTVVIADLHGATVVKDTVASDIRASTYSALNEYVGEDFSVSLSALGGMLEAMLLGDFESSCQHVGGASSSASLPSCISHEANEVYRDLMSEEQSESPESVLQCIRDVLVSDWFTAPLVSEAASFYQTYGTSAEILNDTATESHVMFSRAVSARLSAMAGANHHQRVFPSEAGPAVVYGTTPSGYASVRSRSRRQSVSVEVDTDQIVPDVPMDATSGSANVSTALGAGEVIGQPVAGRPADEVLYNHQSPSANTSGPIRDMHVPSRVAEASRHRLVLNRKQNLKQRRQHPYKSHTRTTHSAARGVDLL